MKLTGPALQCHFAPRGISVDDHEPVHYCLHNHDNSLPPRQFHSGTSPPLHPTPFPSKTLTHRQTLFGTDLFNAPEESETVNRFKDSTIITCVVTYVLAFILILVADKWDIAGTVYGELRLLWRPIWVRVKRQRWRKISFGGESTERLTAGTPPNEKPRRLSV